MFTQKSSFGQTPDGKQIVLFTLTNNNGLKAVLTNYGAILVALEAPDREGKLADLTLGFDDLAGYMENPPYFGATIGRFGNRIAKAKFTLNGEEYQLAANNGENHLHGGIVGFNKVVWEYKTWETEEGPSVKFTYLSPDGEEGYPGNLDVTVIYTLTQSNELKIDYSATTDKATPINLTHHTYWNLGGHDSGSMIDHILMINADNFTPVDENLIPTGKLAPVAGTPMDFNTPTPIGERIEQVDGGYDHNWVLNKGAGEVSSLAGRAKDPKSGRIMEVWTSEPAMQFYAGNFLDGIKGKNGVAYERRFGFCLETQHYPDSINQPNFPSVVLQPGQVYKQVTTHKFSAE